ncbi:MMPL family transporter [Secundilactobacillus oryzae]
MDNLTTENQAAKGAKVLAAHFSQGKATPVSVYIKSDKRLDSANALYQIDNLTTKLKSMPGVQSVTSLTQPDGMPVSQNYVSNQLLDLNQDLKGANDKLKSLQSDLKDNRSDLDVNTLKDINDSLTKLATSASELSSDTGSVQSQVSSITSAANQTQQSNSARRTAAYNRQVSALATQLTTIASNVQTLTTEASSSQSSVSSYRSKVESIAKSLKASQTSLKEMTSRFDGIYNYLGKLQASDAAKIYFMTPEQIMTPTFQRTVINNTSQNGKTTMLTVYLKKSADSHETLAITQKLQDQIQTQLQGTSLKKATVAITGQPVVQSEIQSSFERNLPRMILIVVGLMLLGLMIISRSVLQPAFWGATFLLSSLAGLQLAHLTMRFTSGDPQFNWQVIVLAMVPLTALAALQLIPLAIDYRYNEDSLLEWLLPAMSNSGQTLRHTLFISFMAVFGLAFLRFEPLSEIVLIFIFTAIIFNLALPVMVAALGKLTVTLPARKPHFRRHG